MHAAAHRHSHSIPLHDRTFDASPLPLPRSLPTLTLSLTCYTHPRPRPLSNLTMSHCVAHPRPSVHTGIVTVPDSTAALSTVRIRQPWHAHFVRRSTVAYRTGAAHVVDGSCKSMRSKRDLHPRQYGGHLSPPGQTALLWKPWVAHASLVSRR